LREAIPVAEHPKCGNAEKYDPDVEVLAYTARAGTPSDEQRRLIFAENAARLYGLR
jgi:hypothetical protein